MIKENTNKFMKNSEKYGLIFKEKISEKRRNKNPYITKVENDYDIWIDEEKIFSQSGAWKDYFKNNNEIILEIGTGLGNFFSEEVAKNKDKNYLGLELKYKRLFFTAEKCRKKIKQTSPLIPLLGEEREIKQNSPITQGRGARGEVCSGGIKMEKNNFLLLKTKGENISKFLANKEISKTYVFFPDPWGKKERQKKHRLFQEKFIKDLHKKTKKGGKLIFKTDHREYFDTALKLFEEIGLWKLILKSYDYKADNIAYDKTKKTEFETIFNEKKVAYAEFEA